MLHGTIRILPDGNIFARPLQKPPLRGRDPVAKLTPRTMHEVKDTRRALVRIGYDGRVHKTFRGHEARQRFETEVKILKHLETRGCEFVPKLLEYDDEQMKIVTTNCGQRVDHMSDERVKEVFDELLAYGVRHDDAFLRNITYSSALGRFCIIDFELATLLDKNDQPADNIDRADLPAPEVTEPLG